MIELKRYDSFADLKSSNKSLKNINAEEVNQLNTFFELLRNSVASHQNKRYPQKSDLNEHRVR